MVLRPRPTIDAPDEFDPWWHAIEIEAARVGWHAAYMIGLALTLAAYALLRSGPVRRTKWLFVAGAVLTITGVTLQILSTGQDFSWFGQVTAE